MIKLIAVMLMLLSLVACRPVTEYDDTSAQYTEGAYYTEAPYEEINEHEQRRQEIQKEIYEFDMGDGIKCFFLSYGESNLECVLVPEYSHE